MHITQTFGYKLSTHRAEREWSEKQLADEVNRLQSAPITAQTVIGWQSMKTVPSEAMTALLADLLIEQNPKIAAADKAETRAKFIALADRDRDLEPPQREAGALTRQSFSEMLTRLRASREWSEERLAEEINKHRQLPEPLTGAKILEFEYNLTNPDWDTVQHMTQALQLNHTQRLELQGGSSSIEHETRSVKLALTKLLKDMGVELRNNNEDHLLILTRSDIPFPSTGVGDYIQTFEHKYAKKLQDPALGARWTGITDDWRMLESRVQQKHQQARAL